MNRWLPSTEQVTEALRAVIDPELRRSIVDLGMVRSIEIRESGKVEVVVSLTTPGCPIRSHFQQAVATNVAALDGVTEVGVGFDVLTDDEKGQPPGGARPPRRSPRGRARRGQERDLRRLRQGRSRQVDDDRQPRGRAAGRGPQQPARSTADVYGYSIPRMLGVDERPDVNAERKIIPPVGPAGIKVMSIGFFLERNAAVVWRGPMLHKAIQQFLEDVAWDELDYLLLDLPPGTGDVSMTLAQLLPQARVVVVTTPQPAAQSVARRAADMAAKVDLELLGVIENMSGFTTPDGQRFTIFGEGGGQLLADELEVPLLGKVPLAEELREHADAGLPLVLDRARRTRLPVRSAQRRAGSSPRRPQELPVMQAESPAAPAPGADRRHRAPGRPGPELGPLDPRLETNRSLVGRARAAPRRERVLRRRALPRRRARRCARSSSRRSATSAGKRLAPPAVPLRPRHALLGAARRLGGRARLLRARSRGRQRARRPRPALDARFVAGRRL